MRRALAALIVCLAAAACGDDDSEAAGSRPQGCDAGPAAHCKDAGIRSDAATAHDAGVPHDAGMQHDSGAQQAAGAPHDASRAEDDAGSPHATIADAATSPFAIVTNVRAGRDCRYLASVSNIYPNGVYDISAHPACRHPYTAHFLVRSEWRNEAPTEQQLVIDSATIKLWVFLPARVLQFGTDQLANPFTVTTQLTLDSAESGEQLGIAAFEVIPARYAKALIQLDGKRISATIQLHAHTTSGEVIEADPFEYPIDLCTTCLTICGSQLAQEQVTRDAFLTDACDDNSGNDDRICFDPEC